jgi:hypothetical protein
MHFVAFRTNGSGNAPVGQASRQAVQVPQCAAANGASGASSRSLSTAPRKKKLPRRGWMSMVFLPTHPSPARRAKSRSSSGAVSATASVRHPAAAASSHAASAFSRSQMNRW